MTDVTLFDYANLPGNEAQEVRAAAERIRVRMKRTAEDIVAIGLDLMAVKDRLPHGAFLPWIEAEFGMGRAAALRFMQVADRYDGKFPIMMNLTPTVLYELAAPSTPEDVRDTVEAKAEAGESVSVAEVQRLKREAAEERRQREAAEADADQHKARADSLFEGQEARISQAKADAEKSLRDEMEKHRKDAEAARTDLADERAKLEGVKKEAERAATAKAKAEAADLNAAEMEKHRKAVSDAEANLERVKQDIDKKRGVANNLAERVKEHEDYIRRMKSVDIEAKQIRDDLDEVARVLTSALITLEDVQFDHDAAVLNKVRMISGMCEKMAEALSSMSHTRLVYDAEAN